MSAVTLATLMPTSMALRVTTSPDAVRKYFLSDRFATASFPAAGRTDVAIFSWLETAFSATAGSAITPEDAAGVCGAVTAVIAIGVLPGSERFGKGAFVTAPRDTAAARGAGNGGFSGDVTDGRSAAFTIAAMSPVTGGKASREFFVASNCSAGFGTTGKKFCNEGDSAEGETAGGSVTDAVTGSSGPPVTIVPVGKGTRGVQNDAAKIAAPSSVAPLPWPTVANLAGERDSSGNKLIGRVAKSTGDVIDGLEAEFAAGAFGKIFCRKSAVVKTAAETGGTVVGNVAGPEPGCISVEAESVDVSSAETTAAAESSLFPPASPTTGFSGAQRGSKPGANNAAPVATAAAGRSAGTPSAIAVETTFAESASPGRAGESRRGATVGGTIRNVSANAAGACSVLATGVPPEAGFSGLRRESSSDAKDAVEESAGGFPEKLAAEFAPAALAEADSGKGEMGRENCMG